MGGAWKTGGFGKSNLPGFSKSMGNAREIHTEIEKQILTGRVERGLVRV